MPQFLLEPTARSPGQASAILRGAEAHHLLRVLRARVGDPVDIFDGLGHRWRGVLSTPGAAEAVVDGLVDLPANEPPVQVWLLQGLPKGDRWSWILAKGTELGVTRFLPVRSERTVAGADREGDVAKASRWGGIAAAAAKQCERGALPGVAPLASLPGCLEELGPPSPGDVRLCFAERHRGAALPRLAPVRRVIAAVGPEGGWSPRERELFEKSGFQEAGLGPRILRAETAALAALTLVQSLWGDLVAVGSLT